MIKPNVKSSLMSSKFVTRKCEWQSDGIPTEHQKRVQKKLQSSKPIHMPINTNCSPGISCLSRKVSVLDIEWCLVRCLYSSACDIATEISSSHSFKFVTVVVFD